MSYFFDAPIEPTGVVVIERYPGSPWGDEDVPVPLHQVSQHDSAETPVVLASATPGVEATGPSGRDAIADDDAGPAAIEPADLPDTWEASPPPEEVQPKPALAELLAWRSGPRWLYGVAALLLAALCALSFSLGWQRGSVVAEAMPQDPTRPPVISDTHPHATTDYG